MTQREVCREQNLGITGVHKKWKNIKTENFLFDGDT